MGHNKMTALIDHIDAYLKREGKFLRQLAQAADVPVPTLSRLLNGQRGISAQNIRKLAAAAGESSDDWLLLAGIREESGITITTGLTANEIDGDFAPYKMSPAELELSDKIARLSPNNRSIVESIVNLMLSQNASKPKRR